MQPPNDQLYLALPIIALVSLAAAAWGLYVLKKRGAGGAAGWALVIVAGLAFIFLGAGAINTLTNRRGSPTETAPWLTLIAIAGAVVYARTRRGRLGKSVGEHRKPEVAPDQQRVTPSEPERAKTVNPRNPARGRPAPAVFISYRRSDSSDVTGRIYDRLVQHFGKDGVFKDVDSIPLGVDFRTHLSGAVGQCQVVLAVIGKSWAGEDKPAAKRRLDDHRDFVRIEIESAIERAVPIIPILVQQATMPTAEELPPTLQPLAYRNAIPVRTDPDFHQDVGRLIKGIEAHLRPEAT